MCLLVLAWMTHPRYRLVVAANRDEFHDRPAAPLAWWSEDGRVLAGRDLRAGGTWMGVTRAGRFGVVTNFRELEAPPVASAPSRGELVPAFLAGAERPAAFADRLGGSAGRFAGFNLLVGDAGELHYVSNRDSGGARALEPGLYGLSNHRLDTPWPKLVKTRQRLAAAVEQHDLESGTLFDLLDDREPAPGDSISDSGLPPEWERALSAPFVLNDRYGTRCSTVVLAGHDGHTVAAERRFDAAGRQTGATRLEFAGEPASA